MTDAVNDAPGPCPDAEQLALFARGRLQGEPLRAVRGHALACSACADVLAAFTPAPPITPGLAVSIGDPVAETSLAFGSAARGTSQPRVNVGDVVDGKYRVDGLVGAGGMGVVVAATHVQIGRPVALKFLHPEACESDDAVVRFVREARSIAQIESEHVARLLDVGTLPSGEPYMVMELLRGSDLADLLRTRGPLPLGEAVDFILQASEAVAEAHYLRIVHRDLKPANLFVTQRKDGTPLLKVLDFGISKLGADALDGGLTGSRAALGSPRYMSPEQLKSPRTVGPPTDVWALGCILYELLTGRSAFDGETLHGVALAIATGETPRARATRPDIPAAVDDVIFACLEKDADKRVQTVADLALRLSPLALPESRLSIERICRMTGRPPPPVVLAPRSPRSLLVAGALVAVGAVGVVLGIVQRDRPGAVAPVVATSIPPARVHAPEEAAVALSLSAAPTPPSASALSVPPAAPSPASSPARARAPSPRGAPSATPAPSAAPLPSPPPASTLHALEDRK
jgi:serine/threonine-protein kinase